LKLIENALSTPKFREELLEITKLPERTLRYNLAILKKKKLIIEYNILKDMRKKKFLRRWKNENT
jgi:hypothetical protein